jgi:putative addiction module killer protein
MYSLKKTPEFDKWLKKLKDKKAKAKILIRLQRIETQGNFGDFKLVGEGVGELRIHYAKGYRVYYKEYGDKIILLLIGGDKSSQSRDIEKAKQLWERYRQNIN